MNSLPSSNVLSWERPIFGPLQVMPKDRYECSETQLDPIFCVQVIEVSHLRHLLTLLLQWLWNITHEAHEQHVQNFLPLKSPSDPAWAEKPTHLTQVGSPVPGRDVKDEVFYLFDELSQFGWLTNHCFAAKSISNLSFGLHLPTWT